MSKQPQIIHTIKDLRAIVKMWKQAKLSVGLVPTMGSLHDGHLSLVDRIKDDADKVIVSVFVNPTQFGEGEDFDTYPRDLDGDVAKLATTGADVVFAPSVNEMYPNGYGARIHVEGLADMLEGAERPGHFDGMATVVSKLMLISGADTAIFGEKDYQQLAVIRRFVTDLNIPVSVIGGEIIRENDGLAYSSRNAYLGAEERAIAGQFNVVLKALVDAVERGADNLRAAEDLAYQALLELGFKSVDYVSIVDPDTLLPIDSINKEARVLAVARIGTVRLLDNMAIKAP